MPYGRLPLHIMRHFFLPLALLLLVACSARTGTPIAPDLAQVRGVAPRYQPSFETLREALAAGDDETARAVHARLKARLDAEGSAENDQVRAEARAAKGLADGFAKVLDGRLRVDALDLVLETRELAEAPGEFELVLRMTSTWEQDLVLRSGASTLQLTRIFVTPMGRQATVTRNQTLDELYEVLIPSMTTTWMGLGRYPARLTNDVIAAETRFTAALRTLELQEGDVRYPAQHLTVQPALRIDLAHFLPNAQVEPQELVSYLEKPQGTLPPIMERAVRIAPERRGEALRALLPTLERATDTQFERIAPALLWLAPSGPGAAGRIAWRNWIGKLPVGE